MQRHFGCLAAGRAGILGGDLGGQHHEKDESDERDCVDAVGQRADVGAARAQREAAGLHGVVDVADDERGGDAREHSAEQQLGREPEDSGAQREDEQNLNQVV